MPNVVDINSVRDVIRSEVESAAFFPPHWVAEKFIDDLADAIVGRLVASKADEIAPIVAEQVGAHLPEALAIALTKVLSEAVEQGVARGIREGLAPVAQEFRKLREAHEEQERDDWWKKGPPAEDDEIPF